MIIFCSICKDVFIPEADIRILTCGHLYHEECISVWSKQHKTCPQCRRIFRSAPLKVYFDIEENQKDLSVLEYQTAKLTHKVHQTEQLNKELREKLEHAEATARECQNYSMSLEKKKDALKMSVKGLKEQVIRYVKKTEVISELEKEVEMWRTKAQALQKVEQLIKASSEEVDKMLKSTPCTSLAVRQLCTYVGILKIQLKKEQNKYSILSKENKELSKSINEEKRKNALSESKINDDKARKLCQICEKEVNTPRKLFNEFKTITETEHSGKVYSVNKCSKLLGKEFHNFCERDYLEESKNMNTSKSILTPISRKNSNWEELVCNGPSKRNNDMFIKKSTYLNIKDVKKSKSDSLDYCFDGFGGRKKIRLGGPTPREEFQNIKKKNDKETAKQRK